MLRLHYAPDNASLIVRLALEELGLPYATVLVDRKARAQTGAGFRALNPRGQIPVLETGDGPIFETAAILLWLTETRPGRLAPAAGAPDRGLFLSWMLAVSNGLQAEMRSLFYPERFTGDTARERAGLRAATIARIREMLDALEALAGRDTAILGQDTPGALDLYVAVLLRWLALYPLGQAAWFTLVDWPRLAALARRIETRPAVIRAAAAEGLGPTPFSAPVPPTPPEGSAT